MSADTVGGVFTYATDLVAGLREHGIEVAVATFGPAPTADQRAALERAGAGAVHESTLRLEWMQDAGDDVTAGREWLLDLAGAERADVVHLNGYGHAPAPWRVPVLVAAHSCVLSWWRAVRGEEAPAAWRPYRALVRAGLERADAVVAPTAAMLGELRRIYGPLPPLARVVPNGSAAAMAAQDTVKEPFVLAAGRLWDPAKNLVALDRAARALEQPVLVAGEVAGEGGARAPVHAARALGRLPAHELAALRRRAAVFAAPALYEPFGLAALEAARDRCALVLGDIPSLREVWGDAALFVDPRDPDALGEALGRVLAEPGRAAALGARAQRHSARYTVGAMSAAHAHLYRRLCRAAVAA
jgi:glycogen synthase